MSFAAPFWLWLIAPWVAFSLWLFISRPPRADVPFIALWKGPVGSSPARRGMQLPSPAVLAALVATLAAILAASGPIVTFAGTASSPVTLIVDRGITMSARGQSAARWQELLNDSAGPIHAAVGSGSIDLVVVPAGQRVSNQTDWRSIKNEPSSSLDSTDALRTAAAVALQRGDDPVVVISDNPSIPPDRRLIQIAPDRAVNNVGIVAVAARSLPTPQVMVRLRNQSRLARATVRIVSGRASTQREITLPGADAETNEFFDLESLADAVEISLDANDDLPLDNRAWLVRRGTPAIDAPANIPQPLARVIAVYRKNRQTDAADSLPPILLTDSSKPLATDRAIVVVPTDFTPGSGRTELLHVEPHPLTRWLDWDESLKGVASTSQAAPGGWIQLISRGSRALLAVRPSSPRGVWIGFDAEALARTPNYVILWSSIFDWVAGGSRPEFSSAKVEEIDAQWRLLSSPVAADVHPEPGIYQRANGARQAFNAVDIRFPKPPHSNWKKQLQSLVKNDVGARSIRAVMCVGAILMVLGAACIFPNRKSSKSPPN
jgi:hypothetical protein